MAATTLRSLCVRGLPLALAALALTGPAAAQSMSTNSASYNAGYGRTPDQENRAVTADTRDANGNRVVINGVIQNGADQSFFTGGASSIFAGAGASASASAGLGGATAIGNNLTVITQGNNNVVVVDSRQTNNGTVTASQTGVSSDHGS